MSDQVLRCFPGPEVLVAFSYRIVLLTAVVAVSHQYRDLGAQLRQLERTCNQISSIRVDTKTICCVHAIAVMVAPAVAPASPKHATVEKVGNASLVFAITRGELPVA
jgi:hypothetical protein